MTNAAKEIHESTTSEQLSDDGVLDTAVSFDGTWAKRGFTSQNGVVFVIPVDPGKVLDYHCLSKFLQKCSLKNFKIGKCSTLHLENVTLILKAVDQPWNVKGLLYCGKYPLKRISYVISGWSVTETAKPIQW